LRNNIIILLIITITVFIVVENSYAQTYKNTYSKTLILNSNVETSSHSVTLVSPTLSNSLTFTLPASQGSVGQVYTSNGDGSLSFTSVSGASSNPTGNNYEVQFKNNSSFNASSSFVWDNTFSRLGLAVGSPSYSVDVYDVARTGGDKTNGSVVFVSSESGTYREMIWNVSSSINTTFNWPDDDGGASQGLFTNGSSSFDWQGEIRLGPTGSGDINSNDINNSPDNAYIGGGDNNDINSSGADNAVIYGGDQSDINGTAYSAAIIGGDGNDINGSSSYSVMLGGDGNDMNNGSVSAGMVSGDGNDINSDANYSAMLGGDGNDINGASESSIMFGGVSNDINSDDSDRSMVGAGEGLTLSGLESAVMSGNNNDISTSGDRAAIFGGSDNDANGYAAFVGGGQTSQINSGSFTVIFGGFASQMNSSNYSSVAGGNDNDFNSNSDYSAVLGGRQHDFNSSDYSSVIWGRNNDFSGGDDYSLMGGRDSDIGNSYQLAWGRQSQPGNLGVFYLSDGNASNFNEVWTDNAYAARFSGGFYLSTHSSGTIHTQIEDGDGAWQFPSDRNKKELFVNLDPIKALAKILNLKISSWNYKDTRHKRNYGPMAQDFFGLFGKDEYGTISTDTTISTHSVASVFVAGVQGAGINQKENEQELNKIKSEREIFKIKLEELEKRLKALE
jgi:Chaperone of endosialidase